MVERSLTNTKIGWSATAGPFDRKELITEFQSALSDEITNLKKQTGGKKTEIYDGQRIHSSKVLNIYSFQTDEPAVWRRRRNHTELALTIDDELVFGSLESSDQGDIKIAIEKDKGDHIEEAFVQDLSFELHENLIGKFERLKSGEAEFNFDGSMKLFGFQKPNNFPAPIQIADEKVRDLHSNTEQKIAILKSMSQEVTFIWGPPGTGKTKTLGSILNSLIAAGKSVLLTTNTNAAVDEILKKFIENRENASFINEGKIIRLGIPTVEDEIFNQMLIDKVGERRTAETNRKIEELQTQLALVQSTLQRYEHAEQSMVKNKSLRDAQINEYQKTIDNIQFLQKKVELAKTSAEQTKTMLFNKLQELEKAKTTNMIRRFFEGLNKDQIEAEVKTIENRFRISELELRSRQNELDDYVQKKDAISARIKEFDTQIKPNLDGITTLDSLSQKILELKREAENMRNELSSLQTQVQKTRETIFNEALVISATIARASIDPKVAKRKFDVLIVDEASMVALPNLFYLAGFCSNHYVISGDFRQLPPIATSYSYLAQKWLKRDIFTQAGIVDSVETNIGDDDRLVMLRYQYRMHPSICDLISEAVYCGKLKTPENIVASKEKLSGLPPFEGKSLIFCDTAKTNPYITRPRNSFSRISPYSAAISSNLALKCVEDGEANGSKVSVGIITPYRAQANLISKMIADKTDDGNIVASTIHSFQGSERDCIVFDLVEGEPLDPGRLTKGSFKNTEQGRLITVAISRAIGKFILVGNSNYIEHKFWATDAVPQLAEKIQKNGEIVESDIVLNWPSNEASKPGKITSKGQTIADSSFTMFDQTTFYTTFVEDLKKARSRIVIFSPFIMEKSVAVLLEVFEQMLKERIPIYVVTRQPEFLKENRSEVENSLEQLRRIGVEVIVLNEQFHHKIAVIDNTVFYYGSLNILAHSKSSDSMMAFRTKKTIAQFLRIFGVNKIIKDYEKSKEPGLAPSIIQMIGEQITKTQLVEKVCPICKKKLELNHNSDGFYFACPDKAHEQHYEIEIDTVKNAVAALKIKCPKCSSGHMILQYARESRPFLGCTQYRKLNCQSKLELQDKYY